MTWRQSAMVSIFSGGGGHGEVRGSWESIYWKLPLCDTNEDLRLRTSGLQNKFQNCQLVFGAFPVAQTVKDLLVVQELGFNHWVWKIPWRREWQPTPVLFPGEFHGQKNLAGYSPWSHRESDTIEWLSLSLYSWYLKSSLSLVNCFCHMYLQLSWLWHTLSPCHMPIYIFF